MGGRRAIEEPRVAQHHMIQLMHDQHEEVFVCAAMVSHKLRIDEQPWTNRALHSGCGDRFVDCDVQQPEQLLKLPGGGGNDVEDAASQTVGGGAVHGCASRVNF